MNSNDSLRRVRFTTSHPRDFHQRIVDAIDAYPQICDHVHLPVQSGSTRVLKAMQRAYTRDEYLDKIAMLRRARRPISITTDIIVGFPGETEAQFQRTYDLLEELKLDVAHLAKYSARPGTVADRNMTDDVPEEEKERRWRVLNDQHERISGVINRRYQDQAVEVLVEDQHKGKWRGRTRTNKLVFFEDELTDRSGQLAQVKIDKTGPWSMSGAMIN